jgi:hypothetical protein
LLQFRRPGFDSRHYQEKSSESGTGSTQPREYNWGATWKKSRGSCLENREYGCRDPSRWPRGTLYPQKLAITSPTSGGRSVGIVRSRTQTMKFFILVVVVVVVVVSMALQSMLNLLPLFEVLDPIYILQVSLDERSFCRKASTYAQENTNRINTHRCSCFEWFTTICVREGECNSYPRPQSHCNGLTITYAFEYWQLFSLKNDRVTCYRAHWS